MSLQAIKQFFEKHQLRILKELKQQGIQISEQNIPRIIKTTSFNVRRKNYPEQCPCYLPQGESIIPKPCHPITNLNCFLCGCPYYPAENPSEKCQLNPNYGHHIPYNNPPNNRILDCNSCSHPHFPEIVEQYLRQNIDRLKRLSDELE